MNDTIVWNTRDPLYGYTKIELLDQLKEMLLGRVVEAWIFGSFVHGRFGPDSDIDIIVVCETDLPFTRRQGLFDDVYDLIPAVDLLVYTPAEFSQLTDNPSIGFWTDVVKTMVKLI